MLTVLIGIVSIILVILIAIEITSKHPSENQSDSNSAAEMPKVLSYQEQKEKEKQDRIALLERRKEEAKADYLGKVAKMEDDYGECTFYTLLGNEQYSINSGLYVFEKANMVVLFGERIPFKKILGYNLSDDNEVIENNTSYSSESSTSTSSMLGRAIVGGVLLGGAGALASAATAKHNTSITPTELQSSSEIRHHYRLFLNLDDLAEPIREIHLGGDSSNAYRIANIFNIIVQRNQANKN